MGEKQLFEKEVHLEIAIQKCVTAKNIHTKFIGSLLKIRKDIVMEYL